MKPPDLSTAAGTCQGGQQSLDKCAREMGQKEGASLFLLPAPLQEPLISKRAERMPNTKDSIISQRTQTEYRRLGKDEHGEEKVERTP